MSWIIFALLAAVFAALVAIFGKIGIAGIDTTLATAVRSVIMAGFLVITALVLGKATLLPTINGRALLYIALSGIAGALSWLFYFFALKNGPASGVAALDRTSVVFVLLLAILFLGERLTWKTGIGASFVGIGAILMAMK
ncbi:MAG: EamA family transporter [Patescibacteria group bacterium]